MKLKNVNGLNKLNQPSRYYAVASINTRIILLGIACLFAVHLHAAWLDSDWLHRQQVTISGDLATTEALTNFPVLVQITDQANPLFRKAHNNGQDIVFTAADGVTRLAHEIDSYYAGLSDTKLLKQLSAATK